MNVLASVRSSLLAVAGVPIVPLPILLLSAASAEKKQIAGREGVASCALVDGLGRVSVVEQQAHLAALVGEDASGQIGQRFDV